MGQCHIRDVLAITKSDMKEGRVSTKTMCGLDDPDMNKLTFGDPAAVLHRKVEYPCQKCINRWREESESLKDQHRAVNSFRKLMHSTSNLNRFKR